MEDILIFECTPCGSDERRFCSGGCKIFLPTRNKDMISLHDFPRDCVCNDLEHDCNYNDDNFPCWNLVNVKELETEKQFIKKREEK